MGREPLPLFVSTEYDPHVDFLIHKMRSLNKPFARFNAEDFPTKSTINLYLSNKQVSTQMQIPRNQEYLRDDITSVWYRRPGRPKLPADYDLSTQQFISGESKDTLAGLWELLDVTWVNHPDHNRHANNKIRQLLVASQLGLKIPDTIITNNPEQALEFFHTHSNGTIIKPLSQPMLGERIDTKVFYTSEVLPEHTNNFNQIKNSPVFLQEKILKKVELRTTVVGNDIFTAAIDSQSLAHTQIDWRRDGINLPHTIYRLPDEVASKCLELTHQFKLNFGAIDMIVTPDNDYVFLEINPNGQWAWIEEMTGLPLAQAMITLLTS